MCLIQHPSETKHLVQSLRSYIPTVFELHTSQFKLQFIISQKSQGTISLTMNNASLVCLVLHTLIIVMALKI